MLKRSDIQIRDPFVVPVESEQVYYLYGTTDKDCWDGPGVGFDCYSSRDLENWDGPIAAFRPPADFWGKKHFWAPEVYAIGGRYFMFATFAAEGYCQGTAVLVSEGPYGPFVPHSDGAVTPAGWECLDGTLLVEDDGCWMVFCHEWVQVQDGRMCTVRLSPDLKRAVGEPVVLFRTSEATWIKPYIHNNQENFVNDGPFMYRADNGELLMIWSSFDRDGYAVGVARSRTGKLAGPWVQDEKPLYSGDGGHGMLFRTFEGQLKLAVHSPNETPRERATFIDVNENEGNLWIENKVKRTEE